jgi:predicted enzyme related to lactoylglutathione lyase
VTDRPRLEAVILEVSDLEKSEVLYREGFGIPLHPGDNGSDDRWTGGIHAEISWRDGAYLHFSLYAANGRPTSQIQLTFAVDDIEDAHAAAVGAGALVVHEPRNEPWGRSGRYEDFDGNVIELTQRSS